MSLILSSQALTHLHVLVSLYPSLCHLSLSITFNPSNLKPTSLSWSQNLVGHSTNSLSPSFHSLNQLSNVLLNNHPMMTRAKTRICKPKQFLIHIEPNNTKQALSYSKWYEAMKSEYESLLKNDT